MRFDAANAECLVFTYKEGILSAVAHDLQLRVETFTCALDEEAWHLDARFDARSLRVAGVMRDGVLHPDEPGEADKRTIEQTIVRDVLHAERHPEVRFTSTAATARGDELAIQGTLALHGESGPITLTMRRHTAGWTGEGIVHQPDFGIRPYRAMLGTLRVRADVVVRITVPEPRRHD